ncbi:hypothetical protein C0993_007270 [Termitomyces sp. T159_Od127]|nr:hypothetical protein C0993_007270 [Termitomyces sp. T159_Od127]
MAVKDFREDLTARWKVAHELCYLIACNQAFDDCKDGDIYDLGIRDIDWRPEDELTSFLVDAVWQLISLSTWIVSLTEKLLKECVMSSNLDLYDSEKENDGDVSMSSSSQLLDAPVLLHICHPYFLDNFVTALSHVQRFCVYVKSLTPRGRTAQIARDITVDLINNSGIDVSALLATLEQTRQEAKVVDEHCVTQPSVLTKATLFIKPHDLVDGLGNLSTVPKDADKDIISKNLLIGVVATMKCSQCGGKTTLADDLSSDGSIPLPWRAWEKKWAVRCICGGRWKKATTML